MMGTRTARLGATSSALSATRRLTASRTGIMLTPIASAVPRSDSLSPGARRPAMKAPQMPINPVAERLPLERTDGGQGLCDAHGASPMESVPFARRDIVAEGAGQIRPIVEP